MKILHCSDLHLGKRPSGNKKFTETRYQDYFQAFEQLIEKISSLEIDVFLIAGDIFDKKEINANILERTEALFQKLKYDHPKMTILVIEGNHDVISRQEDSWLEYLKNKGYCEAFSYRKDYEKENCFQQGDVSFYPVGYPGFMVEKALQDLAEHLDSSKKNIVIVHTAIFGMENLPGLVSTETIDLFRDKVVYMAGGHIHSFSSYPKEKPYFFVPGSLEYTNIPREKSSQKGAIYFDTDTGDFERILISPRKRIRTDIFSWESEIEEEFQRFLQKYSQKQEEIMIIPVNVKNTEYFPLERLEEIAEKEGILKVYFEIRESILGKEEEQEEYSSLEEVERELIESWDILKHPESFIRSFPRLKEFSIESNQENLFQLLDEILEEDENAD
ncbi:Ser/Thr phosphatase family protein [Fusobacterium gonidiaformans 3-1-5R]|uniref:Ser/Thr phosphatase family protein n=1 Tax=Fusobacterium gonidiaformans 3-1-5R TaxID=469605 RepID=E5BEJ5_9FUSO|nr:exonuclease SbcCD subunit D [Fusobacterium gonidiaformans]EFS20526.1 Ser/Thr phosphatase family protein [Fusobacterium gonidiaformans 3-1-5R]